MRRDRWHLLWWVFRGRGWSAAVAVLLGVVSSAAESLMPVVVGRALDAATSHSRPAVLVACGVLAVLIGLRIGGSVGRFRLLERLRITSIYRMAMALGEHAASKPLAVASTAASGDIATALAIDAPSVASLPFSLASLAGAVAAYVVIALYLLSRSVQLGSLVLIGAPVMVLCLGRILRPLENRQEGHRELLGDLTVLGADIARGLRVLRGVGGEEQTRDRYTQLSLAVRRAGFKIAGTRALLDTAQVLIPGLFLVIVIWLGAHLTAAGLLTVGDLIAVYGCTAFLVQPVTAMAQVVGSSAAALVGAKRIQGILAANGPDAPADASGTQGRLSGRGPSGADVKPGFTLVAPGKAAAQGPWRAPSGERAAVSPAVPYLFAGRLREVIDPAGTRSDKEILAALHTASADDIMAGLGAGLDAEVDEAGRNLSGGQRQRIALARAILPKPSMLVLVEPTSAVDAVTESVIAQRLYHERESRTTVVVSSSPAFAAVADHQVSS